MDNKEIEKLHLDNLRVSFDSYRKNYRGNITFSNKTMKFELSISDMICREMIRLIAYEIRYAKSILADELELSVAKTSETDDAYFDTTGALEVIAKNPPSFEGFMKLENELKTK